MDYDDILNRSDEEAADRLLATKILDLMDKLRLSNKTNNSNAAKRWIWELLQNAKDVGYEDSGVSVAVDLVDRNGSNFLLFKHNGQPFTAKTITFLIRQVSTKDRKQKEGERKTTGKFGTGFLSTHLLSEKVLVNGIAKEEGLPYRKFSLTLDRTPTELDDVLISVEKSLKEIRRLLGSSQGSIEFDRSKFNTSFEYHLDPEKVDLAKAGIADLHNSLPFTLAFSPEIRSVTVSHERRSYLIEGDPKPLAKRIEMVTINETREDMPLAPSHIVVVRGKKTAIAVHVDMNDDESIIYVKRLDKEQPRLFCDFPLIGSNDFPFPVVVNSSLFNPNDPRSAVWLTNVKEPKVKENEEIMKEAVELYEELLDYASTNDWAGLFNLADIRPTTDSEWLSGKWFDDNILDPVRQMILHSAMIDNAGPKRLRMLSKEDIPQVSFPSSSNEEVRERIWDLVEVYAPGKLPLKEEVHDWYNVIWSECDLLTLDTLSSFIEQSIDLNGLKKELKRDEKGTIRWLNYFYSAVDLDTSFREKIKNDKYKVIPNQNGIFQARSYLKVGKDIDNELKNVLKILGKDIRDELVWEGVSTGPEIKYTVYNQQQLIDNINNLLRSSNTEAKLKYEACDYIVTLFADDSSFPVARRKAIYDFSKRVYPNTVKDKRVLLKYQSDVFTEADKRQIRAIVQNVSEQKNVDQLTIYLSFKKKDLTIRWLHDFVEFLANNDFESQLELKDSPILPNQNGNFTIKDDLNLDDGEIPEELKDISAGLTSDFRDRLLDKAIFLKLPEARITSARHVADEITRLIVPRMTEIPRKEETKIIFKQLYLYFSKNPGPAKILFKDLHDNKHKLYDDEEISASMQKMEEVEQLMKEYDIGNVAELRDLLLSVKNVQSSEPPEKEFVTKEILAALGITSEEEFLSLIGEDPLSGMFRHNSKTTPEMYEYASSIITRARKNIIAHLKTLPEYVFEEDKLDVIAPTVIGGIKKEGLMINIVFRPSDNGQVLFYYPSEKATLDLANAELWIDDGITPPSHLTLGKILTTTGINRIPIK